ncbi:MAG TPA: thioredoxin-disulfide reductase [Dissulfurispiraceae bacterium]|nr:thioredoxin-disulfide reductase [Dissulfurispiraceae bacterium]
MEKEPISDDIKKMLHDTFKALKDDVIIEVFTNKDENETFNKATVSMIEALAAITPKIKPTFNEIGAELSRKRVVSRSPTILLAPDKFSIRYTGSPLGEEGRSFIVAIIMASTASVVLSEESLRRLMELKEHRSVQVFVSPTCPYCPQEVIYAVSAAVAQPELVTAEIIEIFENQDLAEEKGIISVPQTFINGTLTSPGVEPEEFFIESLLTLKRPEIVTEVISDKPVESDVVILGAGPAGLTAAIYAVRAGLKTVVVEKANVGGQVAITPIVENYPGFAKIPGKSLVDLITQQALQYVDVHISEEVKEIEKKEERFHIKTSRAYYISRSIILATGVSSRELNVPGEKRFWGRGVSYCAECDGYFFKDGKNVLIVGGGNTAATDALYLHALGAKVSIVHRKDKLRAEKRLQDSLAKAGIPILWNSSVSEIVGDRVVKSAKITDTKDGKTTEMPVDGIFVAIGYKPNNEIAASIGLAMDEYGYVKVDEEQRTSIKMVYAAGDITGGVKQIVVAVGQASVAALTAFEDLSNPYWKDTEALTGADLQQGIQP